MPPVRPSPLRALLAALLLTAAVVAGGVSVSTPREGPGDGPTAAATGPGPVSPALSDLTPADLAAASVPRAPFCDRLAGADVSAAVGDGAAQATTWDSGETAQLGPGVRDVAHEFGCRWSGSDGSEAEAWVFAPAVTPGRARTLATALGGSADCSPEPEAAPLGDPGVALVCGDAADRSVTHAGLVGDAWLTCRLTARTGSGLTALQDLLGRADDWCGAVLGAASS